MPSGFIIGNNIFFDITNFHLRHREEGDIANLSGVKGRCLICLLKNINEEAIPRKILFEEVWEKHGLYATDNCLLQTIYTLRKELREAGLDDLILTQPRLGYKINSAYRIHETSENEPPWLEDKVYQCNTEQASLPVSEECTAKRFNITDLVRNRYLTSILKIVLLLSIFLGSNLLPPINLFLLDDHNFNYPVWFVTGINPYLGKIKIECRCKKGKELQDNEILRQCTCQLNPNQRKKET